MFKALALICAVLFGAVLGVTVPDALHPRQPQPTQLPSNMELLGEVTTVMDPNDPLVKELRKDDELRARDRKENPFRS